MVNSFIVNISIFCVIIFQIFRRIIISNDVDHILSPGHVCCPHILEYLQSLSVVEIVGRDIFIKIIYYYASFLESSMFILTVVMLYKVLFIYKNDACFCNKNLCRINNIWSCLSKSNI